MNATELESRIVAKAVSHVGEKEKSNNSGFANAIFEKLMKDVGFDKGESWCCLFAELCWTEAFEELMPEKLPTIEAFFSESCLKTWRNAKEHPTVKTGKAPKIGSVAIFQHGTGWQGHAAIVVEYDLKDPNFFKTIEGNTNAQGGREGIEVARKRRALTYVKKPNALNLLGFIYPD